MSTLHNLKNKVIYCEDSIIPYLALEGIRVFHIQEFIIWYEMGTGISTDVNSSFREKTEMDNIAFLKYMSEVHKKNTIVQDAYNDRIADYKKDLRFKIKKRLLHMLDVGRRIYKIRHKLEKKKYLCLGYNVDYLNRWISLGGGRYNECNESKISDTW